MQCPIDGNTLLITHREGIEIDYCPQCRGVWLDRGELDKLIQQAAQREIYPLRDTIEYESDSMDKRKNDDDDYGDNRRNPGKRRGSFLDDIFDIFD